MSDVDQLKLLLADWKSRLSDSDMHSIAVQVAGLLWRSAFYRSLNESRRYLGKDEEGRKQASSTLHEFIDDGFFCWQLDCDSTASR